MPGQLLRRCPIWRRSSRWSCCRCATGAARRLRPRWAAVRTGSLTRRVSSQPTRWALARRGMAATSEHDRYAGSTPAVLQRRQRAMTDTRKREVACEAMLAVAAAMALALAVGGSGERGRQAEGRCVYVGPVGRLRLFLPARSGPPRRCTRRSATRSRRPILENVAETDSERAIEQLARAGYKLDLHDVVRLHGADPEGRQEVPEREVRACDRLQARRQRVDLFGPLLRGPLRHGPDRRQDDQVEHDRLYRRRSRSPRSCRASTRSCSARSRSIRTSRSRSSGSTPGSIRARKPTPPRRCSRRAPTSSPSTPIPPRRCRRPKRPASSASASRPT